jgi:hypothetical protein
MFAAVIVVPEDNIGDALTNGLELGKTVDLHKIVAETLPGLPTASDLALRLVHTFFIITNPDNWQQYKTEDTFWKPAYPNVLVRAYKKGSSSALVLNLDETLRGYFGEGDGTDATSKKLIAPIPPAAPGVGQVWVDTQFEMMSQKTKPGTATAVDATTFKVVRKVGLPSINMNNPHNMWTDKDQKVIYQSEWFDHYLTVFDRKTGEFVRRRDAGFAPAHVMTRTNNDQVHVSQNGDNNVREFDSLKAGNGFLRDIPMQLDPNESAHPHAHWMSADGNMMVSPNPDTENSTVYNFNSNNGHTAPVGHFPIATGMMPDSSKYYVANFLDSSITVMRIAGGTPHIKGTINLLNLNIADPPTGFTYSTVYDTLCANALACAPIGGAHSNTSES